MDININKLLKERYQIVEKIAIGGYSQIYLAKDLILNREVVLKIMYQKLFKNKSVSEVFTNEIKITAQLRHPNIVSLYDYFFFEDSWCLVLEYLRGQTLRDKLKISKQFSEIQTINIVLQILNALMFAQQKNIIHRDIKPENIFLLANNKVKIIDFGISVDKYFTEDLFKTSIIGSLKYLSPEMIGAQKAHWTSDLYSLGIIMFEMLVGELPWASKTPLDLIKSHLYEPLPRITHYEPKISQKMENIIIKATAKNIHDRYQTLTDMIEDVKSCLNVNSSQKTPPLFLVNNTYQGITLDQNLKRTIKPKNNFFWLRKEFLFFLIFLEMVMILAIIFKLIIKTVGGSG